MTILVKICGLSTPETLDVALDAGADMVGFVFFPAEPAQHLVADGARALRRACKGRPRKVALTVDADDTLLASIIEALKPDMLQLHGHETPQRVAAVRESFGLPVMKVLPIETKSDLLPIGSYTSVADRLLFDARAPTRSDAAGRARQAVRLASARESRPINSIHALRRPRRQQCRAKRCASRARPASMSPPGSKARPA